MTFYAENETALTLSFPWESLFQKVAIQVLDTEKCDYEVCVNLLLTDNAGIRELNRESRQIDKETDVLSFPGVFFENSSDFSVLEDENTEADYFDPDTGELLLGDIVISIEKMEEQAKAYGHSVEREFSFLIAHSMLHLCGYDHMEQEEEKVMFEKQEQVLQTLGITRV